MISVEEARQRIMEAVHRTPTRELGLVHAFGRHLAAQVSASHPHPLFDMSAVDGYALAGLAHGPWRVVAALQAGDVPPAPLKPGECMRIFTGAMVPSGTEAVVMQEHVRRSEDQITMDASAPKPGANVRRQGEQMEPGDVLLEGGDRLGAAEVGLLASAGLRTVTVREVPLVAIVRTGGEFAEGDEPSPGRIFSSNELMLAAALHAEGIGTSGRIHTPGDERDELRRSLSLALEESDVVVTTGGVSVGEHDLVRSVLEALGARIVLHGVKQKPGKPMLFATYGRKAVFGLPGNPRAVLVAWHLYVLPFLRAMQGDTRPWPKAELLPLAQPLQWKGGRTEFRAGMLRDAQVHLLADEGSHMLAGMTAAEVLVELPFEGGALAQGMNVTVHHLRRS